MCQFGAVGEWAMFGQFSNGLALVLEVLEVRRFVFIPFTLEKFVAVGHFILFKWLRKRSDIENRRVRTPKEVDEIGRGEEVTTVFTLLHGCRLRGVTTTRCYLPESMALPTCLVSVIVRYIQFMRSIPQYTKTPETIRVLRLGAA